MKKLGLTFGDEIIAAGLGGLPFSWGDTDADMNIELLTEQQKSRLLVVIAAHDPTRPVSVNSILSQDLMAQFNADDLTKIKAAVESNIQFWGLWSAMQAQKDPMVITNARFLAGWGALTQVLGAPRMDEIAAALGVKV